MSSNNKFELMLYISINSSSTLFYLEDSIRKKKIIPLTCFIKYEVMR
jgi:hypothetical protein